MLKKWQASCVHNPMVTRISTVFYRVALVSATTLWMTFTASAAIVCVGPAASGSGSGADWNNLKAWSASPVRGDTWYLVNGAYSGKSLGVAASGSTLITIKKATVADHGGIETGWINTLGDGQAAFSGPINVTTSYWVFDGQTGGGPGSWTSGFGFKITVTADADALIEVGRNTTADNVTVKHIEMIGKGSVSIDGGGDSNDAIAAWRAANLTVSYCYTHGIGRCPFFMTPNGFIGEYNYIGSHFSSAAVHSEVASLWAFVTSIGDCTFRYNVFAHSDGTGGIMWDNSSNPSAHLYFYGNVVYKPAGDTWLASNGFLGGWTGANGEQCRNFLVYNNTFILVNPEDTLSSFPNIYSGNEAKNNLWYACNSPGFSVFTPHDYNHFIAAGGTHSEGNGTSATSGNPFVNYVGLDFRLIANTAPGANLGSPYNVDMLGRTRSTWTRGAIEFGSGTPAPSPTATPAPTGTPAPTATPAQTPTATPVPGGSPIEAESGNISAPFTVSGGYISQSVTTGVTDGGRASYPFTLTGTGDYQIQAFVNGTSTLSNSFYLNIDAEPQDPAMIWDIYPVTTGFVNRFVSWRGSGAEDSNEFQPKIFHLTAGTHQVIIRGREADTQLDRFTILKLPAPPQGLQVVPGP
jgi:hypothetical protein